jgi:hypothetical protein
MDTEHFDAAAIVKNKPWIDRALENVAPTWALRRLESRVQKHLFEYNAARTNRLYAPKQYGQPAESTQNQRDRVVMMWEARDLVENFPEAREISRKFGNYLTPHEYSPTTGDRGYNQIVSEYFHDVVQTLRRDGPALVQEARAARRRGAPGRWRLRIRHSARRGTV